MFNDTGNGQTQYCEECLKKQKIIEELEKENKELKEQINYKFKNYWHKIEMKNNRLKVVLAEIREVAGQIYYSIGEKKQIIDKIDEVLEQC